jgi:hypothetical protein
MGADSSKTYFLRGLDWAQGALTFILLVLASQGKGSHAVYVALWLLLPTLRTLSSSRYRASQRERWFGEFQSLKQFADCKGPIPWRALFLFGMIPILLFALVNGGTQSSGDNLGTVLTAASIVLEGNVDLREFVGKRDSLEDCPSAVYPYFMRCARGGVYNAYPAGMLVFAVPFTLLSYWVGGRIQNPAALRLEKWTAVWVAALISGLFLFIALQLGGAEEALVMTLIFSVASVNLSTIAQGLWTQGGVVTGLLLLLAVEFRGEPGKGGTGVQALAISLMLACRLTSAVLVLIFGLWVLSRNWKRAFALGVASAAAYAPWAIFYYLHYGNILGPQIAMGRTELWTWNVLPGLAGILFSPARGVLVYQPWLCLGVVPLILRIRNTVGKSGPRGWRIALGIMIAVHILLISVWTIWDGGTCYGSRLLAEVVPLGALLLLPTVCVLWKSRQGRYWVLGLGILGFLIQANGVYMRGGFWQLRAGSAEHYWDWFDAPYTFPFFRRW